MQNRLQTSDDEAIPIEVKFIVVDATNSPTVKQRSKNKNNRFYLNFESALLIFISLVAAITIILIQYVINKN